MRAEEDIAGKLFQQREALLVVVFHARILRVSQQRVTGHARAADKDDIVIAAGVFDLRVQLVQPLVWPGVRCATIVTPPSSTLSPSRNSRSAPIGGKRSLSPKEEIILAAAREQIGVFLHRHELRAGLLLQFRQATG